MIHALVCLYPTIDIYVLCIFVHTGNEAIGNSEWVVQGVWPLMFNGRLGLSVA